MSVPAHTERRSPYARTLLCGVLVLCLVIVATLASARPTLTLAGRSESAHLPVANSAFRHPAESHQLFCLQRTMNANTVIYITKFDAEGNLHAETPVEVFWRRYADQGQTMPLRWYERTFGFGLRVSDGPTESSRYLTFNAIKPHRFELRQTAPYRAALFTRLDNREYRMIYAYLDVDESGILPKVTRVRLYTDDPSTGRFVTHTIAVSGGAFKE